MGYGYLIKKLLHQRLAKATSGNPSLIKCSYFIERIKLAIVKNP